MLEISVGRAQNTVADTSGDDQKCHYFRFLVFINIAEYRRKYGAFYI